MSKEKTWIEEHEKRAIEDNKKYLAMLSKMYTEDRVRDPDVTIRTTTKMENSSKEYYQKLVGDLLDKNKQNLADAERYLAYCEESDDVKCMVDEQNAYEQWHTPENISTALKIAAGIITLEDALKNKI